MTWVATAIIGGAVVGGLASNSASKRAQSSANNEAALLDARERERFEESLKQADLLRIRGDEAAAVALEEGLLAEQGAEKLERWSLRAMDERRKGAKRIEDTALRVYQKINDGAKRREAQGLDSAASIRGAAGDLMGATERSAQGQRDAFGNVQQRFQPFMDSEANARGQLDIEMGLAEGEGNRGYRDSPAYMETMRASRQAETDAQNNLDTDEANQGGLYSGRRGEAMMDVSREGSWQRAGVEQSYYGNYMNMLNSMANPNATSQVGGYEMGTAQNIGAEGINAAGTGLNAEQVAAGMTLDTMRSGGEGQDLMQYMRRGDEGAEYALNGIDMGTAGSPYRLNAANTRLNTQATAGGLITGNMPSGQPGSNARLAGVEARNAGVADMVGGINSGIETWAKYGRTPAPANYGSTPQAPATGYMPSWRMS